jgi:hypothetical protein
MFLLIDVSMLLLQVYLLRGCRTRPFDSMVSISGMGNRISPSGSHLFEEVSDRLATLPVVSIDGGFLE